VFLRKCPESFWVTFVGTKVTLRNGVKPGGVDGGYDQLEVGCKKELSIKKRKKRHFSSGLP
jgi:hypothetical protein